jgi:GH24 family phage-related lysozyme (muramidase)
MQRKTIFDAVRRMLGRGFTRAEVRALDQAIDTASDTPADPLKDSVRSATATAPSRLSAGIEGLSLIRQFEGLAKIRPDGLIEAYPDPARGGAPWTIGWGATGPGIDPGTIWTREECDVRFKADVSKCAAQVARAIAGAPTTQAQFDALASFHYNTGAIGRATLTRKHVAGDFAGAAREFARWNRAAGRVLPGLTRRRAAEAELYRRGS